VLHVPREDRHGRRCFGSGELVATDRGFLIELLYQLSLRDDCCSVKYSTFSRDGMYLGRCFLASDAAAGRLCAEHKTHPKLMVSIQDDDFFEPYRAP
jgi:hypothetical protein